MDRRKFLGVTGSASLVTLSARPPRLFAAAAALRPSTDQVVVIVQLSGGNDGLNMVIPFAEDEYHRMRPTLRYPADQVLRLNDQIGLHPSMGALAELCRMGTASIVQGVGYPIPNRSHFESMDLWHSAHGAGELRQTGWLGRWLDQEVPSIDNHGLRAIHIGGESIPRALWAKHYPVASIRSLESMRLPQWTTTTSLRRVLEAEDLSVERDGALQLEVSKQLHVAFTTSRVVLDTSMKSSSQTEYPGGEFAKKLHAVARMIASGIPPRVYYVALDGFDTHANQRNAHATLLQQLSDGIGAFVKDLSTTGDMPRVRMMVFSEFGRRVRENASRGTDHGAAGPVLLVGDRLPQIVGPHPSLADLDQDGDLRFHTDYRRVYATVLESWLQIPSESLLGGKFATLGPA